MSDHIPRKDVKLPPTVSEAKLMARIEELEAKLAKALVALNYFFLRDPDKPTHWEYSRNRAEELARTAIAELKGETDE